LPERGNVFITGATSGIGKACALQLSELGYRVYGTARNAPSIEELTASEAMAGPATAKLPYTLFRMDVRDEESVRKGISFMLEREGHIDAVVNNAAISVAGSVEETTMDEVRDQVNTDFYGTLHVCRAVLPGMRGQRKGLIVNVGSLAGVMAIPFQSTYSACKAAILGLSEALQLEVEPFGIRIVVVEPGDTKTGFTANRRDTGGMADGSPYTERFRRVMAAASKSEQEGWPAEAVAKKVVKIIGMKNPGFRYKPAMFLQRFGATVRKILPDRLFHQILAKFYDV